MSDVLERVLMIPPPIRPTFDLAVPIPPEALMSRLEAWLRDDGAHPFERTGRHAVVTVPLDGRRFWSPYLTLEAQEAGSGSVVHGRFSPKPGMWAGFMLAYIALITAGCFGVIFAASLAMIGQSAFWAMVIGLGLLLSAGAMYLASQIGQRMASGQMDELYATVAGALGVVGGALEEGGNA